MFTTQLESFPCTVQDFLLVKHGLSKWSIVGSNQACYLQQDFKNLRCQDTMFSKIFVMALGIIILFHILPPAHDCIKEDGKTISFLLSFISCTHLIPSFLPHCFPIPFICLPHCHSSPSSFPHLLLVKTLPSSLFFSSSTPLSPSLLSPVTLSHPLYLSILSLFLSSSNSMLGFFPCMKWSGNPCSMQMIQLVSC